MSSNLLSRFLPSNVGNPSIYEAIREHEEAAEEYDLEGQAGEEIDERNLGERFHDQDLDHLLAEATESQITTESTAFLGQQGGPRSQRQSPVRSRSRPKWLPRAGRINSQSEDEDDVPESLLLEDGEGHIHIIGDQNVEVGGIGNELPLPVPGPSKGRSHIQWRRNNDGQEHRTHETRGHRRPTMQGSALLIADPQGEAMFRWTNVENLDNFLQEVYTYYLGKGIWSIMLDRFLYLLTTAFVGLFVSFLTICIDYSLVPHSKMLSQVIIPQCTNSMSGLTNFLVWIAAFSWIIKLCQSVLDFRRLRHLRDFYMYVLDIPDEEMQTVQWQTIVGRLMNLRELNPRTALNTTSEARQYMREQRSKQRMDAHDIANRLMRRDNYLIALFNKDILDLTLRLPYLGDRQLFSKTLAWNIEFCVMDFVFDQRGQINQLFLKDSHRKELIRSLNFRFFFAGVMNVICAPFFVSYLLAIYFLRFFIEFQKHPSQLGARSYTPLAEWKFREFNELPHLFTRRTDMSYPFASRYIDQFPKDKTVQVAKFVAFVAGALGAVLAIASLLDPELFLGFEIAREKTALFYLGILGTIWAVTRGLVPEENLVFDPEYAIQEVINFTHHRPAHWEGRLHSDGVRKEFAQLYQPKILIFLQEILSIIFTPFVLWFSLPNCSERLIDFFREFTIHVDGLGYVCSFAVFEFQKGGAEIAKATQPRPRREEADAREDYYSTKDGKMLTSYFNFLDSYANNPRRGVHREQRSQFQPPPSFPGLSSSPHGVDAAIAAHYEPVRPAHVASQSAVYRTSAGQRAPANAGSPSPSLLLDPRHQPSMMLLPRASRHLGQSKLRPQKQPVDDYRQDEEGGGPLSDVPPQPVSFSTMLAQDSHLGESWRGPAVGPAVDQTDDEGEDDTGEQGVLGLLYQFQKAQTGGRAGAGVGI